jgi:hypothetical protein
VTNYWDDDGSKGSILQEVMGALHIKLEKMKFEGK